MIGLITIGVLNSFPNFLIFKTTSSLLQMPIFYFYVLSMCYSDFRITYRLVVHLILFLTFLIAFKSIGILGVTYLVYQIVIEIQFYCYIIAIFIILKKHKQVYGINNLKAGYASYNWLMQLTTIFCIAHVFVIFKLFLINNIKNQNAIINGNMLIGITALFIICRLVFKALYAPETFKYTSVAISNDGSDKKKIILQQSLNDQAIQKLSSYMKFEKPYLDDELTLQKLSIRTGITEKELSLIINHHFNQHFFNYVNEFRISDAMDILQDPTLKHLTVLEIIYKVGFNSKSSFYTAFKKKTNQTPKQYKELGLDRLMNNS